MSPHRYFTVVLTLACLIRAGIARGAAQDGLADVIERCERAVVRIEAEGNRGRGIGSGFLADSSGTLVTNTHVLSGAQKAVAVFPNGQQHEIKGTLLIDASYDICIAKIDGTNFEFLPLAAELPRKGERVTALGSPKGLSFTATTGIVSAIRPAEELGADIGRPEIRGTWVQVDAALSGGNSGGPLINDRGEVVAMSTLASQGSAQNLNFGISVNDIRNAVNNSRTLGIISLTDGVAKLEAAERPESGAIINRPPVPKDKLEQYVREGRTAFSDLLRGLRTELSRNSDALREMRKGEAFLPPGSPAHAEVVRLILKKTTKYYFRSQGVKDREVSRLQTRVRELEGIRDSVTDPGDKKSLYSLLSKYGPRLDPRRNGSVGFIFDAIVLYPFNDHDIIIVLEDTPYLLWVESTAGLSEGTRLTPVPVYVAGTETIQVPGQSPHAATVLHSVTDVELREALFGSTTAGTGQWRFWKDNTGQYKIEATLVDVTDTEVLLKKRDGTTLGVPLLRLSKEDLDFLGKK
jgi:S1-C subfamily serine protease